MENREEEYEGKGGDPGGGRKLHSAAVASLFSVLTDACALPLDEWPCAE